jgi:hypothetical protein
MTMRRRADGPQGLQVARLVATPVHRATSMQPSRLSIIATSAQDQIHYLRASDYNCGYPHRDLVCSGCIVIVGFLRLSRCTTCLCCPQFRPQRCHLALKLRAEAARAGQFSGELIRSGRMSKHSVTIRTGPQKHRRKRKDTCYNWRDNDEPATGSRVPCHVTASERPQLKICHIVFNRPLQVGPVFFRENSLLLCSFLVTDAALDLRFAIPEPYDHSCSRGEIGHLFVESDDALVHRSLHGLQPDRHPGGALATQRLPWTYA